MRYFRYSMFMYFVLLSFFESILALPVQLKDCSADALQAAIFQAKEKTIIELSCSQLQIDRQIFVDRPITIRGNKTVLDGGGRHRFFVVAKQTGWVIDGRLKPTAGQGGEGIHLQLENMILRNGFSEQIPNGCSKKSICESGNKEVIEEGGAIYVGLWGHLSVKNVTFENNRSKSDGGAIYAHGGKSGTINVSHSSFYNNRAGGGGGAIAVQALPELKIVQSNFTGNQSECTTDSCKTGERGAGAIRVWGSGLIIEKSNFTKNTGNLGGAIGSLQSWFQVSDSHFTDNHSGPGHIYKKNGNQVVLSDDKNSGSGTRGGGAIYADTGERERNYIITGSTFTNNSGPFDGGALYLFMRKAEIEIKDCSFHGNTVAKTRGAAIAIYGKAKLVNLSFKENRALEKSKNKLGEKEILFAPGAVMNGIKMQPLQ